MAGISLQLEELCRSHNLPADDLRALPRDFRAGEADLFACGILLRLADILDFDRTRTPDAVYGYLGIDRAKTRRDAASRTEWRKHLSSDGMRFPDPAGRAPGYQMDFIAAPRHPAVQHDVDEFLDVIEAEFQECQRHITGASPRWRDLPIPATVNRKNIESQGYLSGDFRFRLDQHKLVELLMGENLYTDPYTFVRELLQNALDATRARQLIEPAGADDEMAIEVSEWTDREGYRWIRIDDSGIGMDLDVVKTYLLRIGQSYYSSSRFEAELRRFAARSHPFRPISRFGIGLLSCFIAADRIEIATRRVRRGGAESVPLRLGLERLHGFFVVQQPPLPATLMPSADGEEDGYRTGPGTSVAVRIDPQQPLPPLALRDRLERLLLCPAVPVRMGGLRVGTHAAKCEMFRPGRHAIAMDQQVQARIREFLPKPPEDIFRVSIDIIDLAPHFSAGDISGRVVVVQAQPSAPMQEALCEWRNLLRIEANASLDGRDGRREGTIELRSSISINKEIIDAVRSGGVSVEDLTPEETSWIDRLVAMCPQEEIRSFSSFDDHQMAQTFSVFPLSQTLARTSDLLNLSANPEINSDHWFIAAHAGIVLPDRAQGRFMPFLQPPFENSGAACFGAVLLNGRVRLGLSLNREDIRDLPGEFCLALEYAIRRYYEDTGEQGGLKSDDITAGAEHCGVATIARFEAAGAILDWSKWEALSLFDRGRHRVSLAELLGQVDRRPVKLQLPRAHLASRTAVERPMMAAVRAYLLATRFEVELESPDSERGTLLRRRTGLMPAGERLFPPLTFVGMGTASVFRGSSGFLNRNHPLSQWLLESAPTLRRAHAPILHKLMAEIVGDKAANAARAHRELLEALEILAKRDRALAPRRDAWPNADQFAA